MMLMGWKARNESALCSLDTANHAERDVDADARLLVRELDDRNLISNAYENFQRMNQT